MPYPAIVRVLQHLERPRIDDIPAAVRDGIESLARSVEGLSAQAEQLKLAAGLADPSETTRLDIFHGYMPVLLIAFLVTLMVTPLMRHPPRT